MEDDAARATSEAKSGINLGDGLVWLASQPDNALDGIFTDPPWGVSGIQIAGQDSWKGLLALLLRAAERVVKPSGHTLIWYGMREFCRSMPLIVESKLRLDAVITVQHGGSVAIPLDFIMCLSRKQHEWGGPRGQTLHPRTHKSMRWLHVGDSPRDERLHVAERPQNVVTAILREWFKPGDKIADPFAGSNTTGWAAKRIGIDCYSFEISEVMFQTAVKREQQVDLFLEKARP